MKKVKGFQVKFTGRFEKNSTAIFFNDYHFCYYWKIISGLDLFRLGSPQHRTIIKPAITVIKFNQVTYVIL